MAKVLSSPRECATMTMIEVTPYEKDVLELFDELEFGELLDVDIPNDNPWVSVPRPSLARQQFLAVVRSGVIHFDRVQIHQREPQYAEARGTKNGIKYKKRYRFQ